MTTILDQLTTALEQQKRGRRLEAEALYRGILNENPENADAWHLLGMLFYEAGQHVAAASHIAKAIRLEPGIPMFHNNLGNVMLAIGRPEKAVYCYEQAIRCRPDFADSYTNLGNALQELDRPADSIFWYRKSIELKPGCAATYTCLGNALRSLGDAGGAEASFRKALELNPDGAEAHMNLGNLYYDRCDHQTAERHYRKAIESKRSLVQALSNLGAVLRVQSKLDEAEQFCRQALSLQPNYPEAHSNLGAILLEKGELEQAEFHCRRAVRLKAALPQAQVNLGLVLGRRHRFEEAESCYREALRLKPGYGAAYSALGRALCEQGRFKEASKALEEALETTPGFVEAYCNLGYAALCRHDYKGALQWLNRAVELAPDDVSARFGRAIVLLLTGDFKRGWREYEWRWKRNDVPGRTFPQPEWDGRVLNGETVLVYAEQGLGDSIQFVRYLDAVRERGAKIVLECQPGLVALFAGSRIAADRMIAKGADIPHFDFHVALLSLPRVLETGAGAPAGAAPYLSVDSARLAQWHEFIAGYSGLKVGLVWTGNVQNTNNRHRSVPLESLAPLDLPGVTLFNLQMGVEASEVQRGGLPMVDLSGRQPDIRDTAAAMRNLDLVITADTMTAHLAGALGVPVWTLLCYNPDWRWGIEGDRTPWYPSMRLFRQPAWGDWASVITEVVKQLQTLVQGSNGCTDEFSDGKGWPRLAGSQQH